MASLFRSRRSLVTRHGKIKSTQHNRFAKPDSEDSSRTLERILNDEIVPMAQAAPAWHIHGSSSTTSHDAANSHILKRVERLSTDSVSHAGTGSRTYDSPPELSAAAVAQSIPHRDSSLRTKARYEAHHRKRSQPHTNPVGRDSEIAHIGSVNEMKSLSPLPKDQSNGKPVSMVAAEDILSKQTKGLSLQDGHHHNQHLLGDKFIKVQPKTNGLKPEDLEHSKQTRTSHQRRSSIERSDVEQSLEHIKLPPGFQLQNSQHTVVDTVVNPAVTHEVIHHNIHEIVQEVITKDIHVHHYYTYIQPVKVVEVLPAKHFLLNEVTGEKIEIAAPEGWQMPESLQPHVPDTSMIKASSRHYLVDEEHPHGIPEPAPKESIATTSNKICPAHY